MLPCMTAAVTEWCNAVHCREVKPCRANAQIGALITIRLHDRSDSKKSLIINSKVQFNVLQLQLHGNEIDVGNCYKLDFRI